MSGLPEKKKCEPVPVVNPLISTDQEKLKRCRECEKTKSLDDFFKRHDPKDGYRNNCKECHQERCRKWVANNKEKYAEYFKEWRLDNKEPSNAICKKYRDSNQDKRFAICTKWRKDNPKKISEIQKRSYQKRYEDPMKKLNYLIRGGIIGSITKGTKDNRHWETLVDFSFDQLKVHIEKQFLPGMFWGNHGEWHIDHKIPLAAMCFTSPEDKEFKNAWSLKNLQPLWANKNLQKSRKILYPELYKELTGRLANISAVSKC
jgi:hypothetical protein